MQTVFACPSCQAPQSQEIGPGQTSLHCTVCGWHKSITASEDTRAAPDSCHVCGCGDLWRQKDFPQRIGLAMVAGGAILSTIAWAYYRPAIAIGILMAFAFVDLVLYTFMKDMLVCYRCGARYRRTHISEDHPRFNLELNERYRQEAIRLEQEQQS